MPSSLPDLASPVLDRPGARRCCARAGSAAGPVLALLPALVTKPYPLHMGVILFLAVLQGSAWNILGGYAGQYSVGHAAYFGIGAYTTVMLLEHYQLAPWSESAAGHGGAVVVALVIGSITFRLRGPYFVLASIAVAEIIRLAALHFNGRDARRRGIRAGRRPAPCTSWAMELDFVGKRPFYFAALALAVFTIGRELGGAPLAARIPAAGHPRGPGRRALARHRPGLQQEPGPGDLGGAHRPGRRRLRVLRRASSTRAPPSASTSRSRWC